MSLRPLLLLFFATATAAQPVAAQVIPLYGVIHRPPGVTYLTARTVHFDLIYQAGTERDARELAQVLEQSLRAVGTVLPVRDRFRMPVVVNGYNDRGNGYVTPVPFKQEIEAASLKSRSLSPRHDSWMATVGPHELVHAVQADYRSGFGFAWMLRPFAPDVARAINLWAPPGITEGAAVYLESTLERGAGRLNHGYFEAPFRAAIGVGRPWSLAEALEVPAYTRPSDRYYIGGAQFFEWLTKTRGPEAFRRTTSFHQRFPFLGYGLSLWVGTRSAPWTLGRAFRQDAVRDEAARVRGLGPLTRGRLRSTGADGMLHRRPRWLPDGSILVYRTAYDRRRGLYRVDPESGRSEPVSYQELTDDLYFSVTPDARYALFSRYRRDTWAPSRSVADLHRLDLASGEVTRLSHETHLMAPFTAPDGGLWAVGVDGSSSSWVRFSPSTGRVETVFSELGSRVVSVEASPRSSDAVLVVNRHGRQDAWLARRGSERSYRPALHLSFRNGSVFDASWSPDGIWVILTADPGDVMNVFAWAPDDGRVKRLTNVPYGAMEPAVSPDSRRLVFVELGEQRMDLVVVSFNPDQAEPYDEIDITPGGPEPEVAANEEIPVEFKETGIYRPFSQLAPRMLYPVLYAPTESLPSPDARLGWGMGLALQGADPLQRWSWWAEGLARNGRGWGEVGMATSASLLRPVVRLFDRPTLVTVAVPGGGSFGRRVVRETRGVQAAIGVPVLLSDNVYSSAASIGTGLQWEQERLLDDSMAPVTGFDSRLTFTPYVSTAIAMQSNLRDLMPNTGWATGIASEIDLMSIDRKARRAVQAGTSLYLPLLSRWNGGLRLGASLLGQNRPDIWSLDTFLPRGQEDVLLSSTWSVRYGADVVWPIRFVDDGLVVLPVFLHSVYAFGFGERVHDGLASGPRYTSVGGGIGIQFKLYYGVGLDLRFGTAYRVERGDWVPVFR